MSISVLARSCHGIQSGTRIIFTRNHRNLITNNNDDHFIGRLDSTNAVPLQILAKRKTTLSSSCLVTWPSSSIEWIRRVESEFADKLPMRNDIYNIYGSKSLYPFPYAITTHQLDVLERLQQAVYAALKCVIGVYYSNGNNSSYMRKVYRFNAKTEFLLDLYANKPYHNVGSYRPDFLHEADTLTPRLCEINARFPLNGYLLTQFGCSAVFKTLQTLDTSNHLGLDRIRSLDTILDNLKNGFDLEKPIAILKHKEHGHDVHLFASLLPNVHFVRPGELAVSQDGKKLLVRTNDKKNKQNIEIHIDQFICELHQQELLALPERILELLVKSSRVVVNDLRTIMIGHDKRFLTLLSQDSFLSMCFLFLKKLLLFLS